jgi:hypothetical protein
MPCLSGVRLLPVEAVNSSHAFGKVEGRLVCEHFTELPDRASYPQYFEVIKNPMSLSEMAAKNRLGPENNREYTSLEELEADINLMVGNARCSFLL